MAKTVLIVEDNELNMKLFRDLLEAHGYQTSGTSNGFEALDLVRSLRPDLILMDIQLPQVSGLEVTRWIKDDPELRSIPVVAVTAFAMKGDEERIREGGCEAYLSKPISVGKFIETARRDDARHGRLRSLPPAEIQSGNALYPGCHGHGARQPGRSRARAGGRRRRFPDKTGVRHRADRAGALAHPAQDDDR